MSPIAYGRDVETRSPLTTRDEGQTMIATTTSSMPIIIGATVAVIVVLVAIIVGILVAWKYSIRQRRKRAAMEKSIAEAKEDVFAAHPPKPILRPYVPASNLGVGWVPQIGDKPLPVVTLDTEKEKDVTEQYAELARTKVSPPPSYSSDNLGSLGMPKNTSPGPSPLTTPQPTPQPLVSRFSLPSPLPVAEPVELTLPIPTKRRPGSSLPPTPATPCLTVEFSIAPPLMGSAGPTFPLTPSPRSVSFRDIHNPSSMHSLALKENATQLMSVIHTFSPERDDELAVDIGETLLLVQEYKDGWCLVQRSHGRDAPQGVIPRFCLQSKASTQRTTFLEVPKI